MENNNLNANIPEVSPASAPVTEVLGNQPDVNAAPTATFSPAEVPVVSTPVQPPVQTVPIPQKPVVPTAPVAPAPAVPVAASQTPSVSRPSAPPVQCPVGSPAPITYAQTPQNKAQQAPVQPVQQMSYAQQQNPYRQYPNTATGYAQPQYSAAPAPMTGVPMNNVLNNQEVKSKKSKASLSMWLGIAALVVPFIYSFIFTSALVSSMISGGMVATSAMSSLIGAGVALVCLILGILALVFSAKSKIGGKRTGTAKAGLVTGIIAVIICSCTFISNLGTVLAVNTVDDLFSDYGYNDYYDDYYDFGEDFYDDLLNDVL